jgi:hypothetical protein
MSGVKEGEVSPYGRATVPAYPLCEGSAPPDCVKTPCYL